MHIELEGEWRMEDLQDLEELATELLETLNQLRDDVTQLRALEEREEQQDPRV